MPRTQLIAVIFVPVLLASCGKVGARKLVSTHTAYNDAVQLTATREVLTNIVRARYSDPMQFVKVASINAQFSVSVGGSANVAGGARAVAGGGAGTIGYSDSPTITYVPASDNAFYKSLHSLLALDEGIGFILGYRFARTDSEWQTLSLLFTFGAINGATDVIAGRGNELYKARIKALGRLLDLGASYQLIPEWDPALSTIPKAKVTAEDEVEAFKWGLYFIEAQDGKSVRLADDLDIRSKMFLEAMVATFTSRVGSKQPLDAGPQVVLPIGGG